jgi:spermidine/putrescine transport system substrate-binding protein
MSSAGTSRSDQHVQGRLGRRKFLGAGFGAAGAAFLAACGSTSPSGQARLSGGSASGPVTLQMLNYPGWIAPNEVAQFEKAHPGLLINQTTEASGGDSAIAAQIAESKGTFDFGLIGSVLAVRLKDGGLLAPFSPSTVPNISSIPAYFRSKFPFGLPTDFGKVGLGYRADLVPNPPTSWKEFFDVLPRYSGKVIFPDYDRDVIGIALLALGYSVNSADAGQLNAAKNLVIKSKPYIKAFLADNQGQDLVDASAVMAAFYDYSYGAVAPLNRHIKWLEPSEGMPAYIEGWIPLVGTKHIAQIREFMSFHLKPKVYGAFINATFSSFLEPSAEPYIENAIKDDPALRYNPKGNYQFEQYTTTAGETLRNQIWEEIEAA